MMLHTPTRRVLLSGLALAAIASSSTAQKPVIELRPTSILEAGIPVEVAVKGIPGDRPVLIFASELETTSTPFGQFLIKPASMIYVLPKIGQNGESVFSCNTPLCDFALAQQTYYSQAVTFSSYRPLLVRGISDLAVIEFVTGDQCAPCVQDPTVDGSVWKGSQHNEGFYLQDCDEQHWAWSQPATLIEYTNGTAWLTGSIVKRGDSTSVFDVDITFSGRESLAMNSGVFPPVGSPKTSGVYAAALAANGGPIDPSDWHYYTATSGTLTGVDTMAGTVYSVSRRGPAVQVGWGASLKNPDYGLATWLNMTRTSGTACSTPMVGDINITLTTDCGQN